MRKILRGSCKSHSIKVCLNWAAAGQLILPVFLSPHTPSSYPHRHPRYSFRFYAKWPAHLWLQNPVTHKYYHFRIISSSTTFTLVYSCSWFTFHLIQLPVFCVNLCSDMILLEGTPFFTCLDTSTPPHSSPANFFAFIISFT